MTPSAAEAQELIRADKHPKAPATAGRIPSPNIGIVRNNL